MKSFNEFVNEKEENTFYWVVYKYPEKVTYYDYKITGHGTSDSKVAEVWLDKESKVIDQIVKDPSKSSKEFMKNKNLNPDGYYVKKYTENEIVEFVKSNSERFNFMIDELKSQLNILKSFKK